jgi:hypothetical protein
MWRFVLFIALVLVVYRVVLPRLWRGIADGISGGSSRRAPRGNVSKPAVQMARDPVCGTFVVPDHSLTLSVGRQQLHFCSPACRDAYRARA